MQLIGQREGEFHLLKIKVNVVHAGLSVQLVPLSLTHFLKVMPSFCLNSNLLIAVLTMAITAVMVDRTFKHLIMSTIMESPHNTSTLIKEEINLA